MANSADGLLLIDHITDVLNDLIVKTGKQIDKDETVIWDGFLHQLNNDEWASMFLAFKELVSNNNIFLTHHQQRKFDEAYMTFEKDKLKRERCMDIRNRFMNTKQLAWSMIMTIREVYNTVKGRDIPNVDAAPPAVKTVSKAGQRRVINIQAKIEIWEDLFEVK